MVSAAPSIARMMPLKVAATSVKLAMPPPTTSARFLPSPAPAVATERTFFAYSKVSASLGAPEYSAELPSWLFWWVGGWGEVEKGVGRK